MPRKNRSSKSVVLDEDNIGDVLKQMNSSFEKANDIYTVTLAMKNGETVSAKFSSMIGAMEQIAVDPKTMGVLSIDFNGKHVEKMFSANVLKRMFGKNASPFIKRNAISSYSKFLISGLN